MTDQSELSRLWALVEAALNDYEKQTYINLEKHPLAKQLQHCNTVKSVTTFLQSQVRACSGYQGIDKIMESLYWTVLVLYSLSAGLDNLGSPFPLARIIYAGISSLLITVKDIRTLNSLADLFESIELLLKHLDIYNKIPPTIVVTRIVVKTLVELLSILALATSLVKQGRPEILAKKHSGKEYVEMVVESFKLDRLTLDESRAIAARIIKDIYGLFQYMKVIMKDGKASIDRVRDAQSRLSIMSDVNKSKRNELQHNVRSWLSPPDPSRNHKIACESRYTGTAAWFLHGETFSEWMLSERNSLLWIRGKSGAGKSVLCSAIIQSVDAMRKAGFASLAYFYCDFRDGRKKDLRGLVSSVLVQLCHQTDSYCDVVSEFYSEHAEGSRCPSDAALVSCLKRLLKLPGQTPVYIIVDALDECRATSDMPPAREELLTLLRQLLTSQFPNIHICVTSRAWTNVKFVIEPLSFHSISLHVESGHRKDIVSYIKSVVNTDPNIQKWRATNKEMVIDLLTHKVDGVFLCASCQLAYLRHCPRRRIQRVLDDLPVTLDGAYRRFLLDIDKADRGLAHRLFSCVSVAFRPFRVEELAELVQAINFRAGPFQLFRTRSWRQEDLVNAVQSTYSSFLTIVNVEDTLVVQFSHFSVLELLGSVGLAQDIEDISCYHVSMTSAHTLVAQICLDILLHIDENVIARDGLRGLPLAEYAAKHWLDHARYGSVWQNVEDRVKRLFDLRKSHLAICFWIHDPEVPSWRRPKSVDKPSALPEAALSYAALWDLHTIVQFLFTERLVNLYALRFADLVTPLHLAAKKGHVEIVYLFLERGAYLGAWDKDLSTPLHLAAREGKLEVVHILLDWGAYVTARDKDGSTPLHLASREGQLEVARFLLERTADLTAQDKDGSTPLHLASREGQLEVIRHLLEMDADVTARDNDGSTPLHLASREGPLEVICLLLERDADVTAWDKKGSTPLHLASREGQLEVARVFIKYGANANAHDMYGSTPLHLASQEGQLEVVRFLIDHGANVGMRDMNNLTPLHLALREGQLEVAYFLIDYDTDVDVRDMNRSTLLYLALREGQLEVARLLIGHSSDVNARDMYRSTPLRPASREGHMEIAHFLIDHGTDVDTRDMKRSLYLALREGQLEAARILIGYGADVNARDINRSTLLHLASGEGQPEVARLLIDHGVDVNARDIHRSTPLHVASREGQPKVARILLEQGADLDARDNDNCIPLHWASQLGHLKVTHVLVEHGTDVNSGDISNWTPLHGASQDGDPKVVYFLLKHGANVRASDLGGWTSLQLASRNGDIATVQLLLEYGADANTRDNSNWTPLHCASRWGHPSVVEVLLRYGAYVNARDNSNWTPLHYASQRAHLEVVRVLCWFRSDVNSRGDGNQTPLHLASRAGYLGIVELLVANGANIHVRNDEGRTPVEEASVNGHANVIMFLWSQE